ncbi:hypothetical protein Zmor_012846 [Zophobas morio]|uniref:Uncharacterized protein n=1 Tax=Zophobas morio TaxID=2755281 RepID=A0AA38MF17_9CUCU|nr:hypothetical protein Zmor_012846 [Zophobas morio]
MAPSTTVQETKGNCYAVPPPRRCFLYLQRTAGGRELQNEQRFWSRSGRRKREKETSETGDEKTKSYLNKKGLRMWPPLPQADFLPKMASPATK